jgi:Bardet-Biedl syndrome 5 protein
MNLNLNYYKFNKKFSELNYRKGEFEIDCLQNVEDTKGNEGERGKLILSNLRVIWICLNNKKINLSIGYNCVLSIKIHHSNSRIRGNTQSLYILCKLHGSRFEFVFTHLVKGSPRLFTTIQAVYKAYQTTKMYREIKLRSAIINNKKLNLLPQENLYSTIQGVCNLSSDQGNLGTFFITNVRIVWFADLAENFNVSLPYLQIVSIIFYLFICYFFN